MNDDEPAHWQQFRGTELGSLLTTLYGNPRPAVNYPKLKAKGGEFQPTSKYTSSGAKVVVPTKRNVSVAVPRLTGMSCAQEDQPTRRAPVDCIARRKQADKIKAEIDDIKMRDSYYRGPLTKEIGEREKDRYTQICAFKGGKALPDELTIPGGDAPFELAARKKEQQRRDQVYARRNPAKYGTQSLGSHPTSLSETEQLQEQIAAEINERREYLVAMRAENVNVDETTIRREIAQRVAELQKLDHVKGTTR